MSYDVDMMKDYAKDDAVRETVSAQVCGMMESLCFRAEKAAEMVATTLASVSRQPETVDEAAKLAEPREQWPRLFEDLRDRVDTVNDALARIESNCRRAEL